MFTEPQIRGWYQLKLTTVESLNDQAGKGLGGQASVLLSDYQRLVEARYANQLPGSEHDTNGYSSGDSPLSEADDGSPSALLLAGGSSAALALAGGAVVLRRRRRASTG
ncbi:LPXTG cell wall anchor domain-containing protein [Streptomyces vinaceus]|uniref:LPXTG cell wall anchor domain-containing protein n=1 Tax=Streptomyces vinaceus TaxID=1960 RepID=UPI00380DE137